MNPGNAARRTAARRTTYARARTRARTRYVYRSRAYRTARWRHHHYWHHHSYYSGWWVARSLIRLTAFVVIANSSTTTTHVVVSTTYYHHNPWYRRALYEGEEVYVLTPAPVAWETAELPEGTELIEFQDKTYHYHEAAFYAEASGSGYVVVAPPVGAAVSSIPEDAINDEESDADLFVFDRAYFSRHTDETGKVIYRVEPQPPEEELDEMPADAVTFVADGETYHYVNFNLYVAYEENGKSGYVNGEPEIGAQLDSLPEGATTIEEEGRTYYQFDMVFFEEVEDENGEPFYEVVGSPDGAAAVEVE